MSLPSAEQYQQAFQLPLSKLFNDPQLDANCREIVRDPNDRIIVSSVSDWEIVTKYRIGKLPGQAAN